MAITDSMIAGERARSVGNDDLYRQFNHIDLPLGEDGTPFDYYKALRDRATVEPVGWSEQLGGFWVVAGYDEIRQVMRATEHFTARPIIWPDYNTGSEEPMMIAAQDDPQHHLYRGLIQLDFSPRSVRAYDADVRRMTNEIIDGFIGDGQCEVSDVLADEVPARLTALFLGLDETDSATYRRWVEVMAHGLPDPDSMQQTLGEMLAYFREKIQQVRGAPGKDVLSNLTQVKVDGRPLTDDELVGFCVVLLLGGIHNSAKVMASAFWRLAQSPALRDQLVNSPEIVPAAVEEFMRFYTPASVGRGVLSDTYEIAGKTMQKGDIVMLALPAANRDPRHFDRPDELILDRSPNRHLALGHGMHACLGGSLIRVEMCAVFEEFMRRIPDFELDTSTRTPRWQPGQTAGMDEVVIRFPPGGKH